MKQIIIAICILACAMSTQAQNKIFTKYASMDSISFVCINKAMFNLGSSFIKTATGDDSLGKLSNIDKLLIISADRSVLSICRIRNTARGTSVEKCSSLART